MKPRLLDLFCGAGGAAVGYARAGFDVVGVDIKPQPNYPFEFVQADALEVLACMNDPDAAEHYEDWLPATKLIFHFDAIHASPPCQAYSVASKLWNAGVNHPRLIEPVRDLLRATGLPYVIENVPGAPLVDAVVICGSSVGLDLRRHRLFEANVALIVPPCAHGWQTPRFRIQKSSARGGWQLASTIPVFGDGGGKGGIAEWRRAMEIDWMRRDELVEAIPPAYTELIGHQLMQHLQAAAA